MRELSTQMDKHGRLLIPSQIRNSLNYNAGDKFIIRSNNDELHIMSLNKAIKNAQNLFKKYNKSSDSAVEEFLKQKYLEVENE